jgi:hypothetical protein
MAETEVNGQSGKQAYTLAGGETPARLSVMRVAGERRSESLTESYQVVRQEANATVISTTSAVTLGDGVANDSHLMGLHIHTALAGTCVIAGFADETGAAKSITLPAGTVGPVNYYGAKNAAGALTITCSTAGDDDKVTAFWRPA